MSAPGSVECILIVKLGALGDVVSASALLTRIRAERPGARVTWLCGRQAAPLVELFGGVDEIMTVDHQRLLAGDRGSTLSELMSVWRRLLGRRFDLIILAHPDSRYRLLTMTARATRTHRLSLEAFDSAAIARMRGRSWADEYARLLDGGRSGPVTVRHAIADVRSRFPLAAARARPLAVLAPGGAKNNSRDDPLRRWPIEGYVALSKALGNAGYDVAMIGDAKDAWVREAFAGTTIEDRIGTQSLTETLALMRAAALVVAHDSGPLHLARLVRAPLIALFGPTTPHEVVAANDETIVLWGGADLPCRPCYDGRTYATCSNNVCLREITVAQVMAAAAALGERLASG